MRKLLAGILWASVASAILLAFAWPALVSPDPADGRFEMLGKATLAAFFASLAALLVLKLRHGRRR